MVGKPAFIDANRLGAVGVCLGVGYTAWAAVDHPLFKAFGGVVWYYRDPVARLHYEATGKVSTVPAVALEGGAAMTAADIGKYYGTSRAAVPNYCNAFASLDGAKAELWLAAKSQTEFYDSPELIRTAADVLAGHFHAHL